MNKIFNKQIYKTLFSIMAFIMLLMTVTLMDVHAANNSVSLTVMQTYSTSSSAAAGAFTYTLSPTNLGDPMPDGSESDGYTFTITGNNSVVIGPWTFDDEGYYRYELYQVILRAQTGYTYDRRVYTIEVYVDSLLNATMIIKNEQNKKEERVVFANSYSVGGTVTPPPTDPPETTNPPTDPPDVTDPPGTPKPPITTPPPDPTNPPPVTTNPPVTAGPHLPDTGGGEPEEEDDGIDIDDDGNVPGFGLNPSEEIEEPDDGPVPGANSGQGGGRPRPGIDGPKTGDDSNMTIDIILLASGGLMVIGTTVFLIIVGKRKRSGD